MPPESPSRILFVGDMHLGRLASRLPENARRLGGFEVPDVSPVGAWRRVVQTAIDEGVDAVALAGDVVHQDDDLFEARAHLESGITRLTEAGIAVVAVAGNHDTQVLPVLAAEIDGLHLLGVGGTWSVFAVSDSVRIVGWSFPARHHAASPLRQPPPPPETGVVTLGLLHADRDNARSDYAPVSGADLEAVGYQGWALGHIHAPDPVPDGVASPKPFYLGSITGAIPTETGAHGPVLATIDRHGQVSWQRLVQAPLRWEHVEVEVSTLPVGTDERRLATHLREHLMRWISGYVPGPEWPAQEARALGLRVTLVGEHQQADALERAPRSFAREELVTLVSGHLVFVEKITSAVTLPVDLVQLARRGDPPGLVAREILALQNRDPATAPLLDKARRAVAAVTAPPGLAQTTWTDDDLRDQLISAGRRALNALLQQDGGLAT